MRRSIKLLGIGGSARQASWHSGMLRYAKANAPKSIASFDIADIKSIPLYNADEDAKATPESVRRFKQQIKEADALLWSVPEYNYSMSGFVKNALDWASRSGVENSGNVFDGKPIGMMSAGGYLGGGRAQYALRMSAVFLNMHCLNKPEVMLRGFEPPAKFDAQGNVIDPMAQKLIVQLMEALAEFSQPFLKK